MLAGTTPAGGGGSSISQDLVGYGAVGVFAAVFLAFLLWLARTAIDRERARADAAEAREQKLNESMREQVIPVLTRVTDVSARVLEVLPELVSELKSLRRP